LRAAISLVVLGASGLWLSGSPWSSGEQVEPAKAAYLFSLANAAVDESSGIAVSRRRKGLYWTHNDSGGKAELFAFDDSGKDVGVVTLDGVRARDWEDMASVKIGDTPYLYIGDVGDNMRDQRSVRVHRIVEPDPSRASTVKVGATFTISYPDKPHNCEALMVAPNGDIYLVTKDDFGDSVVFVVSAPKGTGAFVAKKVGEIKLAAGNVYSHMVTGGDISRDGRRVVIRTYFSILLYEAPSLPKFSTVAPKSLPVPLERQGEAICFDEDNRRLITTSEGKPCRVSSVSLP
jgi:hypothetical protein